MVDDLAAPADDRARKKDAPLPPRQELPAPLSYPVG
jgi:hypothetical protein